METRRPANVNSSGKGPQRARKQQSERVLVPATVHPQPARGHAGGVPVTAGPPTLRYKRPTLWSGTTFSSPASGPQRGHVTSDGTRWTSVQSKRTSAATEVPAMSSVLYCLSDPVQYPACHWRGDPAGPANGPNATRRTRPSIHFIKWHASIHPSMSHCPGTRGTRTGNSLRRFRRQVDAVTQTSARLLGSVGSWHAHLRGHAANLVLGKTQVAVAVAIAAAVTVIVVAAFTFAVEAVAIKALNAIEAIASIVAGERCDAVGVGLVDLITAVFRSATVH